jgi:hypothetical protein
VLFLNLIIITEHCRGGWQRLNRLRIEKNNVEKSETTAAAAEEEEQRRGDLKKSSI